VISLNDCRLFLPLRRAASHDHQLRQRRGGAVLMVGFLCSLNERMRLRSCWEMASIIKIRYYGYAEMLGLEDLRRRE